MDGVAAVIPIPHAADAASASAIASPYTPSHLVGTESTWSSTCLHGHRHQPHHGLFTLDLRCPHSARPSCIHGKGDEMKQALFLAAAAGVVPGIALAGLGQRGRRRLLPHLAHPVADVGVGVVERPRVLLFFRARQRDLFNGSEHVLREEPTELGVAVTVP